MNNNTDNNQTTTTEEEENFNPTPAQIKILLQVRDEANRRLDNDLFLCFMIVLAVINKMHTYPDEIINPVEEVDKAIERMKSMNIKRFKSLLERNKNEQ